MMFSTRLRGVCSISFLAAAVCVAGCGVDEGEGEAQTANATATSLPANYSFAWDGGTRLPESERWADMYRRAAVIAEGLNSGNGDFMLKPKEIGGSSLYAYVDEGETRHGLWLPPNASTWILEEVFAFNVSRLLGHGDWAAPASRLTLNRTGSAAYRQMITRMNVSGIQACNKDHQLKYMARNPDYFVGVYKEFLPGTKVGDVKSLVKDDGLNGAHAVAKFLRHEPGSRQPTNDPVFLLKQGSTFEIVVKGDASYEHAKADKVALSTEAEVAAQLNHMMVVDALNNQRDRYGTGTNMNIFIDRENGTFRIALIDNGGGSASIPTKYMNDFKRKVTRFDPSLARKILALDGFLNGGGGPFEGFDDEESLKRALGYEDVDAAEFGKYTSDCGAWNFPSVGSYKSRWDLKWTNFRKALRIVAEHVRANNNPLTAE